ncbi:Flp family type IVb pilin [Qipengyuania citrea]|uniref:Flp family type IVb pilin n=1 Tax=Qipengyuania citrea TaxID=225971 RepID=UPI001E3C9258|nr:Flp family type IVb pilin [Qipengyuania citrea]MCD1591833.1 Flp family type IVb pilin [Qipengyuania citrea]
MFKILKKLRKDEMGATAIEYGLIAALIAVAGITAFDHVGDKVSETMMGVGNQLDTSNKDAGMTTG